MTSLLLYVLTLLSPAAAPPRCESPPKVTVVVACEPDEGCVEKWIFVDREEEVPLS